MQLVFATSDKGGTGRSVTSANMLYRLALAGDDVAYLDFDFRSPTAGAIFGVRDVARGIRNERGLHTYFRGSLPQPDFIDVWGSSEASKAGFPNAGDLILVPGDENGEDFAVERGMPARCVALFLRMLERLPEGICLVDLSAGRSYALGLALAATATREWRQANVPTRWLVFHRWTRQHIIAADGLVTGEKGILKWGEELGWDKAELRSNIKYVRTAWLNPDAPSPYGAPSSMRNSQRAWLSQANRDLDELTRSLGMGNLTDLGRPVPLDPLLQWREQLISRDDVERIANPETVQAFTELANNLKDDNRWR